MLQISINQTCFVSHAFYTIQNSIVSYEAIFSAAAAGNGAVEILNIKSSSLYSISNDGNIYILN